MQKTNVKGAHSQSAGCLTSSLLVPPVGGLTEKRARDERMVCQRRSAGTRPVNKPHTALRGRKAFVENVEKLRLAAPDWRMDHQRARISSRLTC
jgi:hypothetical protein